MLMHAKSHQASQGGGEGAGEFVVAIDIASAIRSSSAEEGEGAGEFVGAIDIASAIRSSSAEELFTTSGSLGGWSNGGSGADAAPPAGDGGGAVVGIVLPRGCGASIGEGGAPPGGGLARLGKVILTMSPGWVLSGATSSILSSP